MIHLRKFDSQNEGIKLATNKFINKLFKGYNYSIYLAGPDVFRAQEKVKEVSKALKEVSTKYKQKSHFPLDNASTNIAIVRTLRYTKSTVGFLAKDIQTRKIA